MENTQTVSNQSPANFENLTNVSTLLSSAEHKITQKKYSDAIYDCDKIINSYPRLAKPYYLKSFSLKNLKILDEAMKFINIGLQIDSIDQDMVKLRVEIEREISVCYQETQSFERLKNWLVVGGADISKVAFNYHSGIRAIESNRLINVKVI